MTNKQTIDGVSREFLERVEDLLACPQHHVRAEYVTAYTELRALLENTALESQYDGMSQAQAQAVSDGVDEILHGKPAAQPQGEVERLRDLNRDAMDELDDRKREIYGLRAQLAERDALLNRWLDMFDGGIPSSMLGVLRESTRSALSFIKEG